VLTASGTETAAVPLLRKGPATAEEPGTFELAAGDAIAYNPFPQTGAERGVYMNMDSEPGQCGPRHPTTHERGATSRFHPSLSSLLARSANGTEQSAARRIARARDVGLGWWRSCASAGLHGFPSLLALSTIVPLAGCVPGAANESAGANAGPRERPPTAVAVSPAFVGPIATYYRSTATLEVEREAVSVARVAGIVRPGHTEEGEDVAADEVILTIENEELRLRVDQVAARKAGLEAQLARLEEMSADLVSLEQFDTIRFSLAEARADLELAKLEHSYLEVRAPFAGRITRRLVEFGQKVSAETPLFRIADLSPLLVRLHVPAKEFRRLSLDQSVELIVDSDRHRLQGTVTLVSPIIDPLTGTIKVTIEVPDYPASTRPGDFVEASVITEQHPQATLVPRTAVITEKGETFVYIAADKRAERRIVETGFSDDKNIEIASGVVAGELVVVKGQRSLEPGAALNIVDESKALASEPIY
jgi:membrane fusion protein (multidrug efflux system)